MACEFIAVCSNAMYELPHPLRNNQMTTCYEKIRIGTGQREASFFFFGKCYATYGYHTPGLHICKKKKPEKHY